MLEKIKKIFLSLLLLLIVFSFSGCAGISLPGGSSNRTNRSAERTDTKGVFKSIDGGKNWERKNTIEGGQQVGIEQLTIGGLAIDPENSRVLYLGTMKNGMYKTENGGDSWYKIVDKNNNLRGTASIYDIAIEKGNSDIIYAAALNENRGVLLKTEDGGKSWTESYISAESAKPVNQVQIDRTRKNIVYIGTEQGGFIKSENRGNSWKDIKWFSKGIKDFVVDYNNPNGIIVLTRNALYKTVTGGVPVDGGTDKSKNDAWQDIGKTIKSSSKVSVSDVSKISSITIDDQNPLVMYMTYENLIFVTRNGGTVWEVMKTITPTTRASKTIPFIRKIGLTNGIIYYGAGNAVYKSEDRGQTWASFDIPVLGDVKYTVSDPKDKNIIYVGA